MENKKTALSKNKALVIYFIVFYAVWALFEFLLKPFIDGSAPNVFVSSVIDSVIIKNLVWTVPAMLLVKHYSSEVHIPLKEMFTNKCDWVKSLPIFAVFAAYIILPKFIANGSAGISSEFGAKQIISYSFVGLTEEMVFRGWLLNSTVSEDEKKKWIAIAVNALMFMLIHFPTWIARGLFVSIFTSFSFTMIIVLSVIFSLTFLKFKNILIPIALHMFWDILVDLIA